MKNKITGIICVALCAIALLLSASFAIRNIIKLSGIFPIDKIEGVLEKGEYVEGDLAVTPRVLYRVDHTTNFIPTGKDRYYSAFDEATNTVYIVKAGKGLEEKAELNSVQHIKGKVYKADSDTKGKLSEYGNEFLDAGYNLGYSGEVLFIDTQVFFRSVINVAAIIVMLLGIFMIAFSPVARKPVNTFTPADHAVVALSFVLFIAGGIALFWVTTINL